MASSFLLLFSLGVDHGGEGFFNQQDDLVHGVHQGGGKKAGRLTVEQGGTEEAKGGAIVHRVVADVEREVDDSVVKQKAKVVSEVGTDNAQLVHGAQDQGGAVRERGQADKLAWGVVKVRRRGLLRDCCSVDLVPEQAQGEHGQRENVDGQLLRAEEER